MPTIDHALIMAAGRGQRMMPLTDTVPKAMAPFGSSTLIVDGLEKIRHHVPFVHVTVGYKGAMLAQHMIEHGVASVLNTDGRTNAWWIYHTLLRNLDEPVFVLTCDNVMELDFERLQREYFDRGAPPCMLVPVPPVPGLEGDYIFHDQGVVTGISRTRVADMYCSGIQVLNPRVLNRNTNYGGDFYSVWDQLIARGELCVSDVYPARWFSVDTMTDLETIGVASL